MPAQPLAGYKVVDFGHYIAGPAVAMMLADFGADVVSITPPGGPRWNHPATQLLARDKTCIELDLKDAAGLARARALAAKADVLIENFRPGVMARLGLSYDQLAAANPGLVYLSLPGFASADRERANLRAFEAIISAASGQFTDMGLNRVLMGIDPSFSPLPLASAYGAALGLNAVLFALYGRGRDGKGDHIEVPLAAALMEGLAYNSQRVENYPERYKSPREKEIERRRAQDLPLDLSYAALQDLLDPFYRSYRCSDGRMIYVVCASHIDHARRCLGVLGLLDEIRALGIPEADDWYKPMREWAGDCALGHYPLSRHWADIVSSRMAEVFLTDTAFGWEQKLGEGRVPARAHRTTQEWLDTDHALQAGLIVERPGGLRSPGPFAWLGTTGGQSALQAETLASKPSEVRHGPWLSGLKILDMTNVIAGPTIAALLARFGTEIIKVDPVKPTFDPWNTIVFGMQAGRGKKSVLADIHTPEGREILNGLIRWADLITINAVDRQVESLGLDEASLRAINPDAILCQVDAFGGPMRGPMSDHLGYDDTVQAMTGVMIRFGGGRDTPEEHAHFGTIDVLGGFLAAAAAGAALLSRSRHGEVRRARSSLTAAGQLIQLPFMFDFPGRGPFDEPSGPGALGAWAGYRFYLASDRRFFLACADAGELRKLACVLDLPEDTLDEPALEQAFRAQSADYWVGLLRGLDFGAVIPSSMAGLRDRYRRDGNASDGTYAFQRHAIDGGSVELFAPCAIRPAAAPILSFPPAEKYGASTRGVLRELGYGDDEIDSLIRTKCVSTSWSTQYLPD
ncbi:MAG TPA: CoA transferase [Mesorhizobium sp.]|jgi:crotonobetainyl-CoA:carnitine CoA-transferase CaiB-like acyl-CoA transferase|uniref:CoA transferase n=1 Tax=Mesorhizobium sp. TaxID=1871066 RepID=UPI002DDC944B|nr:CoA transferase [Mesorhizobium sp.]HEV2505478.1 CoA transferase [Mesorhizobium sp.]